MTLNAYPQKWLIPDSIPRQKASIYLFLICLTSLLIFFYSYPLSLDDHWQFIKQKITAYNSNIDYQQQINASNIDNNLDIEISFELTNSSVQQKLFPNRTKNTTKSREFKSTGLNVSEKPVLATRSFSILKESNSTYSEEFVNATISITAGIDVRIANEVQNDLATRPDEKTIAKPDSMTAKTENSNKHHQGTKLTVKGEKDDKISTIASPSEVPTAEKTAPTEKSVSLEHINMTTQQLNSTAPSIRLKNENTANHTAVKSINETVVPKTTTETVAEYFANDTIDTSIDVRKGYLVFSEHCRIPDIDPMDPSIVHLISKTPPLDCSEGHKPLTRTEGNVLFLNVSEVIKQTGGKSYTCCYRSVFRNKEGLSDNGVGFGKECIIFSNQTTIKDEFIEVQCKYENFTMFYNDFHSFIFDKSKVEKRCKKAEQSINSSGATDTQYSVLIIGADAVSRLNMHRQLNATAKYLLDEMDAVEMYGFNKVGDNTFPNLVPLLLGYDERELPSVCWKSNDLPLDRCNFMWKKFAKKGYRTLYAEDTPHISTFNYVKHGFYIQPTDYYFRHFILAYEDALGRNKPLNCYLCVGSTSETEAVLHWTKLFATHFANRPYFSFSWINSVTHDFLNAGSSADHMYERFFRTLRETGALNKTIVVLMGDHGQRWGEIRNTYVGRMEERQPMLMISLPKKFKQDYPEFSQNLRQNSHRLVTPFDLYATLEHLLDLRKNWTLKNTDNVGEELSKNFTKRAISLFQPVPEDRSCDDAFIDEHWCTCESSIEVDIKTNKVKRVAKFLLDSINDLLKPILNKCALLKLDSITDARLWEPPSEHKGHSANDRIYTVVIKTSPSGAIFEGTVKTHLRRIKTELLGTISRLNLYGNQSSCMDDAILKKYCYCL